MRLKYFIALFAFFALVAYCGAAPSVLTGLISTQRTVSADTAAAIDTSAIQVYVMSGQSNSTGSTYGVYGTPPVTIGSFDSCRLWLLDSAGIDINAVLSRVKIYDRNTSTESLLQRSTAQGSNGLGLGAEYAVGYYWMLEHPNTSDTLFIAKHGSPGSAIDTWNKAIPSNYGYSFLTQNILGSVGWARIGHPGKTIKIVGFDWMQGESDNNPPYPNYYYGRLDTLISNMRSDSLLYPDTRIMINGLAMNSAITSNQISWVAAHSSVAVYVDNTDLTTYDLGTHFTLWAQWLRGIRNYNRVFHPNGGGIAEPFPANKR